MLLDKVNIIKQVQTPIGWQLTVAVENMVYQVTVDKAYWSQLTGEQYPPADLVKKSFYFLLSKETKEQILPNFNIKVIGKYFTDFEEEVNKL